MWVLCGGSRRTASQEAAGRGLRREAAAGFEAHATLLAFLTNLSLAKVGSPLHCVRYNVMAVYFGRHFMRQDWGSLILSCTTAAKGAWQ